MIKNILVALDGSEHGDAACSTAFKLETLLGGYVTGIHVRNQWLLRGSVVHDFNGLLGIEPQLHMVNQMDGFLKKRGERIQGRFLALAKAAGRDVGCKVITGGVADEIVAESGRQDLLVIGARGVTGLDGEGAALGGSHLPTYLFKHVGVPMLVCPLTSSPMKSITVAFDGSAGSFRALSTAAELASRMAWSISVVWVDSGGLEYRSDDAIALASTYLRPFDLSAKFVELSGKPLEGIVGYMADLPGEILAIGSHGTSRLKDLFLGRLPTHLMESNPSIRLLVCP